jgi:hypothetical protein
MTRGFYCPFQGTRAPYHTPINVIGNPKSAMWKLVQAVLDRRGWDACKSHFEQVHLARRLGASNLVKTRFPRTRRQAVRSRQNHLMNTEHGVLSKMTAHSKQLSPVSILALRELIGRAIHTVYSPCLQVHQRHLTSPSLSIPISDETADGWVHRYVVVTCEWLRRQKR